MEEGGEEGGREGGGVTFSDFSSDITKLTIFSKNYGENFGNPTIM